MRKIVETGKHYNNPRTDQTTHCFEGDIAFSEEATDEGNKRIPFVCTYVSVWNVFVWMCVEEYHKFKNEGISEMFYLMGSTKVDYNLNMEGKHYAGAIWTNPELIK